MKQINIPYDPDLQIPAESSGKIDQHHWPENDYRPEGTITLVYSQEALKVRLWSNIQAPQCKAYQDNGDVWKDTCMELFLKPFAEDPDYINIECNALGYMLIGKGVDRNNRTLITSALKPHMEVSVALEPGKGWSVEYQIPFQALEEIFGRALKPKAGTKLWLNAYLCGDETPLPHWVAWNRIDIPNPDFHRSDYFGEGVLADGTF